MRRFTVVVVMALVAGLFAGVQQASAQGGGGCQLSGTANFTPGLTNDAADFTYNFTGTLSGCQSNDSNAPTAGAVSAGVPLTIKGQKFQEPIPKGNGSCSNGTTSGISIIAWEGGAYTVISYTTDSAAAAVLLQGSVVPSVTLKAIRPKRGQPRSYTIKSTVYQTATGDSGGALGLLTFNPGDPTACGGDGVKSAA